MPEIIINLPLAPSLNNAYVSVGRRRVKSKAYRDWLTSADQWLWPQYRKLPGIPVEGPFSVHVAVPQSMRGDCSNRIKLVEDFLVSRGITGDDRHCQKATAEKSREVSDQCCRVTIQPLE